MTDRIVAYVAHALPGRVRIRVPARKGDAAFFESMRERLTEIPDVIAAAANPITGSFLIHFHGESRKIADAATALLEGVRLEWSPPPVRPLMEQLRDEFVTVNASIVDRTGGEMDARAIIFLALMAVATAQILRGNIVAPAATMAWYAAELMRTSQLFQPPKMMPPTGTQPLPSK